MIEFNFVYLLILGNLKWQAVAWPLKVVEADDRMMRWVLDSSSSCQWLQCSVDMPAFQTKLVWNDELGIHWQKIGPSETFALLAALQRLDIHRSLLDGQASFWL